MIELSNPSRRRFLALAAGGSAVSALAFDGTANHDSDIEPRAEVRDFITPDVQKAIDRGLAFLAATQNRTGSFGDRIQFSGSIAVTSLAALALMSAGHFPGRGEYGTNVLQALRYILDQEKRSPLGFINLSGSFRQHGMYGHGFATLFLAELFGMIPDQALQDRVKGTVERAVRLIEATQNREGGWRYDPTPQPADISVTICQIMALRTARNAGFTVHKPVVDLCVKYIKSCQNPDGGYSYMSGVGGSAFARSAGGLVALYSAGVYEAKENERTLKYLMRFKPSVALSPEDERDAYWYYGQYYAAQAFWTSATRYPRYWNEWFPALRDELMKRVRGRADGSWPDPMACNHYGTAMALIVLQISNNYLPIMQK